MFRTRKTKPKAYAVIGAGYGDEGKGAIVDKLAFDNPEAIVVRSNSGAQAGHTVTTPEGERHVFHHFGSGALAGARTHLSKFFVAHPMMFLKEHKDLKDKGACTILSIDPRATITTPFDVIINQAIEIARGKDKHGSCGLGFGETIERNTHPEFALMIGTAAYMDGIELKTALVAIRDKWLPKRLEQLGIALTPELAEIVVDPNLIHSYIDDVVAFVDNIDIRRDKQLGTEDVVIFESAQGLLLDQDYGAFPHVTRSNTGLRNIEDIAVEAGIDALDAIYATRAYVTRHGAGPLAHEEPNAGDFSVYDPTNVPNDWQGSLRFAPLDLDVLNAAIKADLAGVKTINVTAKFSVSCLDQAVEPEIRVVRHGDIETHPPQHLATHISRHLNLPPYAQGWGPTRKDYSEGYALPWQLEHAEQSPQA